MNSNGFIIVFWEKRFSFLSKMSIFYWIRKIFPKIKSSYSFVEMWVLGNLIISTVSSYMAYTNISYRLNNIIFCYATLRIFEIIIYQINVLLFDGYRTIKKIRSQGRRRNKSKGYRIKSATRMVILLLHNYVEIIFWYSSLFIILINWYGVDVRTCVWSYYIKESILCMTVYSPTMDTSYLLNVIFIAKMSGFIMTTISLARFIGLLPNAKAIDKY